MTGLRGIGAPLLSGLGGWDKLICCRASPRGSTVGLEFRSNDCPRLARGRECSEDALAPMRSGRSSQREWCLCARCSCIYLCLLDGGGGGLGWEEDLESKRVIHLR